MTQPDPLPEPIAAAPAARPSTELRHLFRLLVAVVVIAALYLAQDALVPITLAVLLSFVLSPLVNLLGRIGLWRAPAVIVSVLVALGAIGLVGTLLANQAATLAPSAPAYAETIERKVQGAQLFAASRLAGISKQFGLLREPAPAAPAPRSRATGPQPATPRPLLVEVAAPATSPLAVARTILTPVLGPLETMVIVLVVAIFVLMQKEDLRDRFIRLFGSRDLHRTTMALDDAAMRLSRYFVAQLAINTCFGLVITLGLWILGIPSPALWGVLAGILRFVPYLGALLAAVAPLALATAVDPGWAMVGYVALVFVIVEPFTGYVVEPLVYGHSTGLSPLSVIVSAVFWAWMWGPIGLILSTPLTLFLVVVGRHVESLEFLDVLLGDRPALAPVDRFYQRILANDPDEVLDQAEAVLADRPLLEFYDDVMLRGLKLAAEDQARGAIDRARSAELARTVWAVVTDLAKYAAPPAAPDGSRPLVACIAGRGPFDDVVAAMLAQVLEQRGLATRRLSHAAVARDAIGALDLSGVSAILLSYVELTGSPAHLRYLVARLRQRAEDVPIIVGLWPEGESVLADPSLQQTVAADRYVTSLRAAVDAVLAVRRPSHAVPPSA
ncbi:MAG: AI-2E family transporter [Vicinamibacterales bacterium]